MSPRRRKARRMVCIREACTGVPTARGKAAFEAGGEEQTAGLVEMPRNMVAADSGRGCERVQIESEETVRPRHICSDSTVPDLENALIMLSM
jgi:hypothetical protein